ncbi:hypothetical protein MD535_24735 [Vibrio sp. ZSDZ65]|uniref:Uncharacterized protein n=1 Tax=Vibrio qingdaonensis TaxID=2829491 RepID=A0A9X3CT36_9VIBR|nr:hypothetical protein [Vibrio qingdaonensis]MCW8349197.1 hypothetical protein [Vibrio qingdaonensis]
MKAVVLSPDLEDVLWIIYQKKGRASVTLEDLEPIIEIMYKDVQEGDEFLNTNRKPLTLKRKIEILVNKLESH